MCQQEHTRDTFSKFQFLNWKPLLARLIIMITLEKLPISENKILTLLPQTSFFIVQWF